MKAVIYHAENTRDSFFYKQDSKIYNKAQAIAAFENGGYKIVGTMVFEADAEDDVLNHVYHKSQNIDEAWNKVSPCRSTSVGDIIKIDDQLHIVASVGFDRLK